MSGTDPNLVKVAFAGEDGQVETLWAFDLGDGRYRLDSTPWFQYLVSWKDIVSARPDSGGQLRFVRVLEKSGHRTVRIAFNDRVDVKHPILTGLQDLGCSFEGANSRLFAIDIPPGVSLEAVRDFLASKGVQWEYADPTYTDLHGKTDAL
jgi:uncharacterized protein DUF4265